MAARQTHGHFVKPAKIVEPPPSNRKRVLRYIGRLVESMNFHRLHHIGYSQARFGDLAGLLLPIGGFVNLDSLRDMHWSINFWTDDEVLAWKNSYLGLCNAVAVAAAIFATLGLSALSLPNLYQVHWTARACISVSMVLGIMSVMTATSQYQQIGMLNNPLSIRLYLSKGKTDGSKYRENQPFNISPLESSIAAVQLTDQPMQLLGLAVIVFLVGFGLYCLLFWLEDIGVQSSDWRNVFIAFCVTLGGIGCYNGVWGTLSLHDLQKRQADFDLKSRGSYEQPHYLKQLQKDLERIQNLAKCLEMEHIAEFAKQRNMKVEDVMKIRKQQEEREDAEKEKKDKLQVSVSEDDGNV